MKTYPELKAALDELDAAREYCNSDYYWKRRQELVASIDLLVQIQTGRFNSNQTT
jgi:hypothetical protein